MARQSILIVDDQPRNLLALERTLEVLEVTVVRADSGNSALAATLDHEFALAIVDVQMPGMSGFELARLLHGDALTRTLPIIFVTAAYVSQDSVFKGYEAGAVDYLTKPYEPQILVAKVRVLLELDAQRRELTRHREHLQGLVDAQTADLRATLADLTRTQARENLARRTLELLNRMDDSRDPIREILDLIRSSTDFDAVGIRLRDGDDYPYYETTGFAPDFVTADCRPCDRSACWAPREGETTALACLCGQVIAGQTDPSRPCFTPRGSFCTNDAAALATQETTTRALVPMRGRCIDGGYRSIALIPLRTGEETIGLLQINNRRANTFSSEQIQFLEDLASSIAIAWSRKKAQVERIAAARKLDAAFHATTETLARAVETRDPYTAGHQRRVAHLGAAIAQELGLQSYVVETVRVAGTLHDVGKMVVPSEILSKPGRLSSIELSLMKAHVQAGYDMIRGVEFPWPVADVVLMHHERLDGTGYPRGLTGGAIRFEACILAVADTVEAMASHRPYRPALGLDAALSEIGRARGTALHGDAVDACVRLFATRDYALPAVKGS